MSFKKNERRMLGVVEVLIDDRFIVFGVIFIFMIFYSYFNFIFLNVI